MCSCFAIPIAQSNVKAPKDHQCTLNQSLHWPPITPCYVLQSHALFIIAY